MANVKWERRFLPNRRRKRKKGFNRDPPLGRNRDLPNRRPTVESATGDHYLTVIVLDVGGGALRPVLKVVLPGRRHREQQLLVHRPTVGRKAREQELVGKPDGVTVQRRPWRPGGGGGSSPDEVP